MKKKKIIKRIVIISLILIAITAGLIKFLLPSGATNAPLDNNGLKTTTIEKPKSGSPLDYSYNENLYIAAWVIENASSYEAHTEGTAVAKSLGITVNQSINDKRVKSDGIIFTEAISYSSFKAVAEQRFFSPNQILLRLGKAKNATTVTWKDSVKSFTTAEFDEEYGSYPNSISKYICTDDTIINSAYLGKDENGYYVFEYELETEIAPSNFSREVKHMSGSSVYPTFHFAKITLTIDDNWTPITVKTYDNYDVKTAGLDANTTNNLVEYFDSFNKGNVLPEKDFFTPYLNGEINPDNPITDELSATEYLGNAFAPYLVSPGNFSIDILSNGKNIPGNLSMNLISMDFKFLLNNELYIRFKKDKLYLVHNDYSALIDVNTFKKDLTSTSSLGEFDLEALLANCTVNDDGTKIVLTMPIEMAGIKANVVFYMHYDNGNIKLDYFDATLTYNEINIYLKITPSNNSASYPSTDGITNDLSSISEFIEPLTKLFSKNSLEIDLSSTIPYDGTDYKINLKGLIGLDGNTKLNFKINSINFTIYEFNGYSYIEYEDIKIKITNDELVEYLNKYMPEADFSDLSNINFNNIFENLIISDNVLELTLSLDPIKEGLGKLTLSSYILGDSLVLSSNDTLIKISSSDDIVSLRQEEYNDLSNTIPVDEIYTLITNDNIKLTIDEFTINDLIIHGEANLIISDKYLDGTFYINDNTISIMYNNEKFYIQYLDYCIEATANDISEYLSLIELPPLDINQILEILKAMTVSTIDGKINISDNNYGLNLIIENDEITKQEMIPNIDFNNLKPFLNNLLSYYENGYIDIVLEEKTITKGNAIITYDGIINFDINKLEASSIINARVLIDGTKVELNNINLYYQNKQIYLSYGNIKLALDLNTIASNIQGNQKLSFDLAVSEIIKLTIANMDILISTAEENIIADNEYFSFTITKGQEFALPSLDNYESVSSLQEYFDFFNKIIETKALTIANINSTLNINGTSIDIYDSYINLSFKDGLKLEATINANVMNTINTIKITLIDEMIYASYGDGIAVKLTYNDINSLITLISDVFGVTLNKPQIEAIDLSSYISSLTTNPLQIALLVSDELYNINFDIDNSLHVNISPNSIISNMEATISSLDELNIQIPNLNYKNYEEVENIILFVKDVIDLAKEQAFNLSYGTTVSDYTIKDDLNYSVNTRAMSGSINIQIFESGKFDFRLTCYMTETIDKYADGSIQSRTQYTHTIEINIVSDQIFCTYYSDKGSDANKVKLKMDIPTILTVVKAMTDFMNLDIPFMDSLSNIDSLDTSILDQIKPEVTTSSIDLSYYLKDIFATDNSLGIVINKEALSFNDDLTITVFKNNGVIESLQISDITSMSNQKKTTCINTVISLSQEAFIAIAVPSDSDQYDDFSSLDDFLNGVLETAKLKDTGFHIEGLAKMTFDSSFLNTIIGWLKNLPEIELTIDVSVDEKGLPTVYVKIANIQELKILLGAYVIFNDDTTSEIYYKDGMLYTVRTLNPGTSKENVEKRIYSMSYFNNHIIDEVVYLFNFGKTIEDAIRNSEPDSNYPRRLDTVYKKYSSSNGSFNVSLSGSHLIEGSEVGDINFTLYENENKQLSKIVGSVKLVNIITFDFDLELKNIGQPVAVIVPNKEDFTLLED